MRALSTAGLTGLVTKSLAPAWRQKTSCSSPLMPVSMMTGSWATARSGWARRRSQTSAPLRPPGMA